MRNFIEPWHVTILDIMQSLEDIVIEKILGIKNSVQGTPLLTLLFVSLKQCLDVFTKMTLPKLL